MSGLFSTWFTLPTALLCAFLIIIKIRSNSGRNPPGPKQLPLIGNVLDFPKQRPWEVFATWQKLYGDVTYLNVLGTRMLILNSLTACNDLLDKRSAKYSGRPRAVMLCELIGFDYILGLMDYSPRWREHRRLFHQQFNENESLKYRATQERYVHLFLRRLLDEPGEFLSHVRLLFGETILDVVYDIKPEDDNRVFINVAEKAMDVAAETAIPGQFLVDVFPLLKHVPSWFPGAKFKRLAASWKPISHDLKELPFAYAKKKMEEGNAKHSVLMSMLENSERLGRGEGRSAEKAENAAKECASQAYAAGADTTFSTIQTLFMVLANNQDAQRAAQEELDALLGSSPTALPSFEERAQLPFVTAITQEMFRWHNVVPMGVPHVLTEDDEYNGFFLRKGTIVFPNIWHILRDSGVYPDPFTFNPRRWLIDTPEGLKLSPNVPDPGIAFGFGRRICPGRHFAQNSLFITAACVLACFDIQPLDAQGQPTHQIDEAFTTTGLLRYPIPYKVSIKPRSSHMARLIRELPV